MKWEIRKNKEKILGNEKKYGNFNSKKIKQKAIQYLMSLFN
jgi:hypothetical protein